MRRFFVLSVAASAVACTALLGDFKIGTTTGDGGGTDGSTGDAPLTDGPAAEGEAGPPPMLTCTVDTSKKFMIKDGVKYDERMAMFNTSNDTVRFVLSENDPSSGSFTRIFEVRQNSGAFTVVNTGSSPLQGQINAVVRVPGQTMILKSQFDFPPRLEVSRWPDTSQFPNGAIKLTVDSDFGTQIYNLTATLAPMNVQTDDYLVGMLFSDSSSAGKTHVRALRAQGTAATMSPITDITENPELGAYRLVTDTSGHGYLLHEKSGGQAGGSTMYTLNSSTGALISTRELAPVGGVNFISSIQLAQNDPLTPGVQFAFIEGDLVNGSAPPSYRVGTIDQGKLGTFQTKDLAETPFKGIEEIMVDKARCEATSFAAPIGPQIVCIGRNLLASPAKGANFGWWNSKGDLRAKHAAKTALIPNELVEGAVFAFRGTPNALLAGFYIAWLEPYTVGTLDLHKLWIAEGSCK